MSGANFPNQNPEQIARDNIDLQLQKCGWIIQNKQSINLSASTGIAVREYIKPMVMFTSEVVMAILWKEALFLWKCLCR
jgi:type I site-specific restriction endonuclease